jgi:hypothetical protein
MTKCSHQECSSSPLAADVLAQLAADNQFLRNEIISLVLSITVLREEHQTQGELLSFSPKRKSMKNYS